MLPPLGLLSLPPEGGINEDHLVQNARILKSLLEDFQVKGQIVKIRPGPIFTVYELDAAPGTRIATVADLAPDIARIMSAMHVEVTQVPGRSTISVLISNLQRDVVFLRELLATDQFEKSPARLTVALGKDIGGGLVLGDIAQMQHLLIGGTSGSGKSAAIDAMLISLLYRLSPEELRFLLIDPKYLDLVFFDGIPHLLAPVVTEDGEAIAALKWAVRETEKRCRAMAQVGARNINSYNQHIAEMMDRGELTALSPLPFIVVVIKDIADIKLAAGRVFDDAIGALARSGHTAGIHLIMATHRPSVDVLDGKLKACARSRICFQVASDIDSRTVLEESGAENLLGAGDMFYKVAGHAPTRVHGAYVSEREIGAVVDHIRAQRWS